MSLARIRKAPSRLLERVSNWRRTRSRSRSSSSSGRGGGRRGHQAAAADLDDDTGSVSLQQDEPLLTEKDHKELMNLLSQNISMDFILEMKEAFQLFDKVSAWRRQYLFLHRSSLSCRIVHYWNGFSRYFCPNVCLWQAKLPPKTIV